MKVAVYTIALNEAANAERWAASAMDADYRIVADTGSTDDTVSLLTAAGVTVHKISLRPFRFDVARNSAMALIPADVDVCCSMDMDRYLEPGWREQLEAAWKPETTTLWGRVAYRAAVDDPKILRGWPSQHFHARWGYRFRRPVHETLSFAGQEVSGGCAEIVMSEVQELGKETRRQYLPLMELAHREDPDDGQICFWLGRDYMWAGRPGEASPLFERYLALPTSKWTEERSEAMRYLARTQPDNTMAWLDRARIEAPHRREIWLDLAEQFHAKEDWLNLFWAASNGIEKTRRTGSYLDDEDCWGPRLFELGAIAAWRLKWIDRAVEWGHVAVDLEPNSERLATSLALFRNLRTPAARDHAPADVSADAGSNDAWCSGMRDARALRDLKDEDGFVRAAHGAFRIRPARAEPLHELSNHYLATQRAEEAARYAEAALSVPMPKDDGLPVDEALYANGLRHTFSVAASWSSDPARRERGRAVCDWLALDRDTPENVRKTARYNSGWFAPSLGSLVPSLDIVPLSIATPEGFHPSNVGICRRGDGFAVTVRAVNYVMSGGYHVKGDDPSYRSRTLLLAMDANLHLGEPVEVTLPPDLPVLSTETLGLEDPRPFLWRDGLWCVSSARQVTVDARPEMVLTHIDQSESGAPRFVDWRILPSGVTPRWEKNWMPLVDGDDLQFIYSLDPTRVLTDTSAELVNAPAPIAAETFFGGSQAVPFESGWLTVIHEFEWVDRKRRYFHRFVWLDDAYRLRRLSRRFYMIAPGYEFVAGMAWHPDNRRLVVSFSQNDHDPYLALIEAADLRAILLHFEGHRQASDEVAVGGRRVLRELELAVG